MNQYVKSFGTKFILLFFGAMFIFIGFVIGFQRPYPVAVIDRPDGRLEVVRVSIVEDSLAPNKVRGIYVLKDKKNGLEYFAVEGLGITLLREHDLNGVKIPMK